MNYCEKVFRELSAKEKELIAFLLHREDPDRLIELEKLKVVGRCGCGKCPTILLSTESEGEPSFIGEFKVLADYMGTGENSEPIGVQLLLRNGRISELEAWSPAGCDIEAWPELNTLVRIEVAERDVGVPFGKQ